MGSERRARAATGDGRTSAWIVLRTPTVIASTRCVGGTLSVRGIDRVPLRRRLRRKRSRAGCRIASVAPVQKLGGRQYAGTKLMAAKMPIDQLTILMFSTVSAQVRACRD